VAPFEAIEERFARQVRYARPLAGVPEFYRVYRTHA
jgi:hypothetical protein